MTISTGGPRELHEVGADRVNSRAAEGVPDRAGSSGAVFMVVSGEQLGAAKAVARHLPFASYALNPYTALSVPLDDLTSIERPVGFIITPRTVLAARRAVRRALALTGSPRPVLVIGQDCGVMERVALAAARAAGALVAMMPDGIQQTRPVRPPASRFPLWLAIRLADRMLVASRLLVGRRGDYCSSGPELVLSWGAGWDAGIRQRAPGALIADSGSPRSDALAAIPPPPGAGNILVCSQCFLPAFQAAPSAAHVAAWYAWLTEISRLEDPRIRVRLHPGERAPRYKLPREFRPLAAQPARPLHEDIGWADAVISPYSTVLVEAVAAGRVPITAGGAEAWGGWAHNPFLEDPRVACVDLRRSPRAAELMAAAESHAIHVSALRDEFMAHVGDASRRNAQAIAALADGDRDEAA